MLIFCNCGQISQFSLIFSFSDAHLWVSLNLWETDKLNQKWQKQREKFMEITMNITYKALYITYKALQGVS